MKKLLLTICVALLICVVAKPEKAEAQIPVTDVANLAQNALDYLESLAQTLQLGLSYGLELEEMAQIYLEWEATIYRIQSLAERFGADPFKTALELLEVKWGDGAITQVITSSTDDGFIDLSIGVLAGVLGGTPLEDSQVSQMTEFIENDDIRNTVSARLRLYSARDLALRDSMLGAAAVNERMEIYKERYEELQAQAASLGANSDTATLQFIALAQLFNAQQSMEQLDLTAKMFGNEHQGELMENMDSMQSVIKRVENREKHLNSLKGGKKFKCRPGSCAK